MTIRALLFLTLAFIHLAGFGQTSRPFHMGWYLEPSISFADLEATDVATISNVQNSSNVGFGLGLIFLYQMQEKLKIRSLIGFEFPNSKLEYQENSEITSANLDFSFLEFSIQGSYLLIESVDLSLSYSPRILFYEEEAQFRENLASFDNSIDIGLGYEIKLPNMRIHPELRYSRGLRNLWTESPSEIGQAVSSLRVDTLALLISFYGELKRK